MKREAYREVYIPGCTSGWQRGIYTRVYLRVVYMPVYTKVYLRVVYMPVYPRVYLRVSEGVHPGIPQGVRRCTSGYTSGCV